MTEIPLFNSDILHHIYNNFLFFFKVHGVYKYFLLVIAVLLANWLFVKRYFEAAYANFAPIRREENNDNVRIAFAVMLFSFLAYVVRFLSEEQTILNNFDSMSPGFLSTLLYGAIPTIKGWRFTPISHIDGIFIYGITNNYLAIGWYCVLKQVLILFLMYKCFYFIPRTKRFYLIALINFVPAVFCVNNIVFPEQNMIIFVLLSLMTLNKFQKTGVAKYLLWFLLFMNCAIYTKETVMLFYAGCGIYLLFEGVRSGRISFELAKKPWQQLKKMPVEWLMFVSMLVWIILYYAVTPSISKNRYLLTHAFPILKILRVYAVELLISVWAAVLLVQKIRRKQFGDMNLFMEGCVIGSLIISAYIAIVLRIVPSQDYAESYYLYLPAVFCTIYIFENVERTSIKQLAAAVIAILSLYQNYDFYINMDGDARRELMEFFETKAPKTQDNPARPLTVYFYSANLLTDTVFWKTTGWRASM